MGTDPAANRVAGARPVAGREKRGPRRRWRLVIGIVLGTVLALGTAYLAVGAWAWDSATKVAQPGCSVRWAGSLPSSFIGKWRLDPPTIPDIDVAGYHWDEYEEVQIASATPGLSLAGWWSPPTEAGKGVVLVVHGRNSCRRDPAVLLPAGMLHRAGFGVLLVDLRDHGDSDTEDGRWAGGVDEWQDVQGAWAWLRARGYDATTIGLYGASLGTGAVTLAMGREPAMAAAFLDSPWAELVPTAAYQVERQGKPGWVVPGAFLVGQLISGDEYFGLSPERVFRERLAGRPVAIVHGTKDSIIEVEQGIKLAEAAEAGGTRVDPWILEGVEHVQAAFVETEAYERRLVDFFTEHLAAVGG